MSATEASLVRPLTTEPNDELVRKVRVLVVEQNHCVTSVSRLTGLSRTQVNNIVSGRCYKDAGGPIRTSQPRIRGERRYCSRCRFHFDEEVFAVIRDHRSGICNDCVKPEDFETHSKSWETRKRQAQQRAALRAEIEQLSAPPWGASLLDDADRQELEQRRAEIKRAKVVCGAPWAAPRRNFK